MRISRKIAALGAFFVAAVAVAGCGSGIPGDSVASVAGNPITLRAFNHWMYVASKGNAASSPGAPVIVPTDPPKFKGCIHQVRMQIPSLAKTPDKTIAQDCSTLFTSLSSQVMTFLIESYWYQAEAAKDHVKITDAAIQKALETAKKQQFPTAAAYQTFLKETGQTQADINYRLRINQIAKDLIARNTPKITPAAITAYFHGHAAEFGTPATRNIRIVRTNSESQANAALAALNSGQSWATVAKKYSVDVATKDNGGLLTGITNGEEEQALNKVAFGSPVNTIEGPVHGTFGWYIVEVLKIVPATQETLAKATPLIKQLLTSQDQSTAQTTLNKKFQKDYVKLTHCRSTYAMADCSGYKAPATTTSTAPTATGSTGTATVPTATTGTVTSTTATQTGTATATGTVTGSATTTTKKK
jgi:parvulin-like peptidyl-prolyl isomerase